MSRLKNLYKSLIENQESQKESWCEWHDSYPKFYGQVEQIRERIKSGKGLSPQSDEAFLTELLYERWNGISTVGQSTLSYDNFQLFIKNKDFISALEQFIRTPDKENFNKFKGAWSAQAKAQGKSNNPLRVNRVAAACTLEVSTTVSSDKFERVFKWLIHEGIIKYWAEEDQDWFSKNTFLMRFISDEFSDELRDNKTDKFCLSMFVLVLHENLSNPLIWA